MVDALRCRRASRWPTTSVYRILRFTRTRSKLLQTKERRDYRRTRIMPFSHLRLSAFPSELNLRGNDIQMRILAAIRLNTIVLVYLAAFFTIKLLGVDK